MALFGGGVMIGPILGPVLGGWLTDNYNWRWVFLVNLPVGVICALLMLRFMPRRETHSASSTCSASPAAIALGGLQMFLDRGEQKDWFESWEIISSSASPSALPGCSSSTSSRRRPPVRAQHVRRPQFLDGLVFMAVTGVLLLAGLALLPPLLQHLYGYSVLQSGFLTAPRGVGTLISMLVAGRLVGKVDSRLLVGLGVSLMGVSLWMMTGFALDQPSQPVIVSGVVQGLGLGLIFVPLQSLAFETLAPRMRTTAASLLNLARNIGGSVGISVVSAQLVRMTQVAHADIASHVTAQTIPTADPTMLQTIAPQGAVAMRQSTPRSPGRPCSSPISTTSS
jgi:DHA2 family multidrug resistance protein